MRVRWLRGRVETSCRTTLAALACLTWGCSSSESQGGAPPLPEAGTGDATYPEGGSPTGDAGQSVPDGGRPGSDASDGGAGPDASDAGSVTVVDGGHSVTLMTHTDHPQNLVVDGTTVYWIDMASETVRKAPRAGGPMTAITSGEIELSGIAVDASNVYWSLNLTGQIRKAPVGGGAPTTLLSIPPASPADTFVDIGALSIDATSAYWTDGHAILLTPLAGGGAITTAYPGTGYYLTGPQLFGGSLYFCTSDSSGPFYRVPVTGGSVTSLGAVGNATHLFTVASEGIFVGLTDIYFIPAAGLPPNTLPTNLVTLTFGPSAIVTDATSIYWATDTISKAPKSGVPAGSSATTLASGQGKRLGHGPERRGSLLDRLVARDGQDGADRGRHHEDALGRRELGPRARDRRDEPLRRVPIGLRLPDPARRRRADHDHAGRRRRVVRRQRRQERLLDGALRTCHRAGARRRRRVGAGGVPHRRQRPRRRRDEPLLDRRRQASAAAPRRREHRRAGRGPRLRLWRHVGLRQRVRRVRGKHVGDHVDRHHEGAEERERTRAARDVERQVHRDRGRRRERLLDEPGQPPGDGGPAERRDRRDDRGGPEPELAGGRRGLPLLERHRGPHAGPRRGRHRHAGDARAQVRLAGRVAVGRAEHLLGRGLVGHGGKVVAELALHFRSCARSSGASTSSSRSTRSGASCGARGRRRRSSRSRRSRRHMPRSFRRCCRCIARSTASSSTRATRRRATTPRSSRSSRATTRRSTPASAPRRCS